MIERWTVGTVELAVTRAGSGPPLLLLHDGGSTAARDFGGILAPLADRFRVVAPDLRGHGASARVDRLFWPGLVRDVALLLEGLALGPAHVLGVGDGATLALHLAIEEPARVASLVLAGARVQVTEDDLSRLDALRPENLRAGAPALAEEHERLHGSGWETLLDRWVASFRLDRGYLDVRARLRDVKAPTLLLHGARDPLTSGAHAEALVAGVKGAKLKVLPGGRRVQDDAQFPRVVADFWAGVAKALPAVA